MDLAIEYLRNAGMMDWSTFIIKREFSSDTWNLIFSLLAAADVALLVSSNIMVWLVYPKYSQLSGYFIMIYIQELLVVKFNGCKDN